MGADSAARIERVDIFSYDLTYRHGDYVMSSGRVINRLAKPAKGREGVLPVAYPARRFTPAELAAADGTEIDDLVGPGLQILLVGINPGRQAGAKRLHFGNPANKLWGALFSGGLTPRLFAAEDADELRGLGIGITNLVMRTTQGVEQLKRSEYVKGASALKAKVAVLQPRAVVILGVGAYEAGLGRRLQALGSQTERLSDSELWVLPNPSPRNIHYSAEFFGSEFAKLRIALGLPVARSQS